MPTLVTDCDDTLIHASGDPEGKPREHVVEAIELLQDSGWRVLVWSAKGSQHAVQTANAVGLKVPPEQCFAKPTHPYTEDRVRIALGTMPDLQFDDLEQEAIPGVLFVHTPRSSEEATQEALDRVRDKASPTGIIEPPTREPVLTGDEDEKRIEHRDGRWYVIADSGRSMGDYATEGEAVERLRQVEGHKPKSLKYNEDQARDSDGRFGSGGGEPTAGRVAGDPHTPTAMPSFTRFDDAASRLETAKPYEGQHVMAVMRLGSGASPQGTLHVTDTHLQVGTQPLDPMDVRQLVVYGNWKSFGDPGNTQERDDHGRFGPGGGYDVTVHVPTADRSGGQIVHVPVMAGSVNEAAAIGQSQARGMVENASTYSPTVLGVQENPAQGRVSDHDIEALRQDILNDSFKHEGGGGATFNMSTGEHLYAGPGGNAVGVYNVAMNIPEGERGTAGRPSDSVLTNPDEFRDAVRGEISRFSDAFNAPGANLGLWVDQGHLYVDAVYLTRDANEAADRAVQYGNPGYMEMGHLQDTNLTGAQLEQANANRDAARAGTYDPFTKSLKYSEDQARDDRGRFAGEGSDAADFAKADTIDALDGFDKGVTSPAEIEDEEKADATQDAVDWYTSSYAVNDALRAGGDTTANFLAAQADNIRMLDSYIASNTTSENYVGYRGTQVDASLRGLSPEEMVGKTYTDPAYTSMSGDPEVISGYQFTEGSTVEGQVQGPPAEMVVYIPQGSHIGIDTMTGDVEGILPRDTSFTVVGAETRTDPDIGQYTHIEVIANTDNPPAEPSTSNAPQGDWAAFNEQSRAANVALTGKSLSISPDHLSIVDRDSVPDTVMPTKDAAGVDEYRGMSHDELSTAFDDAIARGDSDAALAIHQALSGKSRYRVKYSDDQPRDEDGRFASGGGTTYYHGTTEENANTILSEGLKPQSFAGVWVSTSADEARRFGSVILQVDATGVPVLDTYEGQGAIARELAGPISPDRITRMEDIAAGPPTPVDRGNMPITADVSERLRRLSGKLRVKYSEDEERDDHGRWTSGGEAESLSQSQLASQDGRDAEHPFHTSSVDDAARALAAGKYVDLDQPRGESTLVDKLAAIGNDARAKGEKAPVYDLGKVTIQGTNLFMNGNLGVPRVEMPQFTGVPAPGSRADLEYPKDERGEVDLGRAFTEHLQSLGIGVTQSEKIPSEVLRATQDQLDGVKVAGMAKAIESGAYVPTNRDIWTTKDDYVLDGHHTWAAATAVSYQTGEQTFISANVIDMPITDALREAQTWTAQMGLGSRAVGKTRLRVVLA